MTKKTKNATKVKKQLYNTKQKITLKDLPHWLPYTIFALTTVIFFWDILLQNAFFWEDFIEYVYPVQTFAAVQSANGIIPFWNPFSFMGMPFLADLQTGFFYPLNRILTLFVSGESLSPWAIEFVIILHFFIAQIAMYYLAKSFKVSSQGAIISAISYSFSMLMVCHVIHPMIVYHLAWLPMILMYFIRGIETKRISLSIIAGIILGLVMLSGHPQILLYIVLLLGIVFVWYFVIEIRGKQADGIKLLKIILAGVLPILIGVGIFMIQYLPSTELAEQSQRSEITYEKATEGALQFKNIYTAVVPDIFGSVSGNSQTPSTYYNKTGGQVQTHFYWETAFYFGIVALLLGLFAILRIWKTARGAMLLFIALFGFLFALGSNGILFDIIYNLPYFGTFRNPGRMMFYLILAFSIFAGIGFDELWRTSKDEAVKWQLPLVAAVPFLIAFFTMIGTLPDALGATEKAYPEVTQSGVWSLFLILAVFTVSFLLYKNKLKPTVVFVLLFVLSFFDLFIAGSSFNKGDKNPADIYALQPQLIQMFVPRSANDLFRVNTRVYKPVSFSAMQRNQGMISRIHQVEGYNPLVLKKAAIYAPDEKTSFDLSNVKYQVAIDMKQGSWNYLERNSYYPRARMLYSVIVKSDDEVIDFMKTAGIDFNNVVVLNKKPENEMPNLNADEVEHNVKILWYRENEFAVEVETVKPGILNLSEIWYPDWKAYVDGREVEIYQAYNSFRAVEVPAGKHLVTFEYASEDFTTGAVVSLLTFLFALAGYFVLRRYESNGQKPESSDNSD